MPLNGFSVGRDQSLDIITPSGPLRFGLITNFSTRPDIIDEKVKGLDGVTRHVRFPDGWRGTFDVTRQDSQLDRYFAQIEADYYAGRNETTATITETITEVDGSVSQYRYTQVLLSYDEAGGWEGAKTVKQRVSFMAARRVRV